jgi:hypothetical protein
MPPPKLLLELLLMIAHHFRDGHGKLHYSDLNSFLKINRTRYACLNPLLWKKVGEHEVDTQHVLKNNNNLASLSFFLELGADVKSRLPALYLKGADGFAVGIDHRNRIGTYSPAPGSRFGHCPPGASLIRKRCQSPVRGRQLQLQPHACRALG